MSQPYNSGRRPGTAGYPSGAGNAPGRTGRQERRPAEEAPRRAARWNWSDISLVFMILFILAFGLIILYSASYYDAAMNRESNYDPMFYLKKQGTWMMLGLAAMFLASLIPYRFWWKVSYAAYFGSLLLVAACLAFPKVNGAHRWIRLGSFNLQPAELVKIAVIILMARMIVTNGRKLKYLRTNFLIMVMPLAASALIYGINSNLSSAIIVTMIAFFMLFVGEEKWLRFFVVTGLLVGAAALLVHLVLSNTSSAAVEGAYRFRRIIAWQDPEAYAATWGFQTIQALYAIGSGGFMGKGLGRSLQKLSNIPEVQNDMIFSIICEELGLFGAIVVLLMFGYLCYRLMVIAENARDIYGSLLVVGVLAHISVQVLLNIAVVTNTLPNTGVTLPFISYGGSSVLFTLAEMGIALNVARSAKLT